MKQKIVSTYWPYIFSGFAALLSLGFLDNIRGPFFPDVIRDLQLTDTVAALFYATPSLVMVLGSSLVPKLLTYFKPLNVLRLGLLFMGLGFIYFGFLKTITDMIVGGIVFGLGFGIVNVMQNYMIQVGAEPRLRQRLFSGLHANYAAAALLVPLVANLMKDFGWSRVFMYMGTIPIVVVVGSFFIADSEDHYRKIDEENKLPREVFFQSTLVALGFAFYLVAELSLSTRLVHYLETDLGYEKVIANYHFFGFFIGMFISRLVISKFHINREAFWVIALSGIASSFSFLGVLFVEPWLVVLAGLFFGPVFPFFLEYLSVKFGPYSDRALAIALSVSAFGVVIMHTVVGHLSDSIGIQKALLVGPVGVVIFVLIMGYHNFKFSLNIKS